MPMYFGAKLLSFQILHSFNYLYFSTLISVEKFANVLPILQIWESCEKIIKKMPLYGCKYKHFLQKYQIISTISDNITQMIPAIAHQMIPFVALLMIPAFNAQEHKV